MEGLSDPLCGEFVIVRKERSSTVMNKNPDRRTEVVELLEVRVREKSGGPVRAHDHPEHLRTNKSKRSRCRCGSWYVERGNVSDEGSEAGGEIPPAYSSMGPDLVFFSITSEILASKLQNHRAQK